MKKNNLILALSFIFIISSCSNSSTRTKNTKNSKNSTTTGWKYNNSKNGGYELNGKFQEQAKGPGLLFIEGG